MGAWIDVFAAAVGWVLTLFIGVRALRARWSPAQDFWRSGFTRTWLFALCLTLYFTFRIEAVALAVDAAVPWNNLSRVIAYICVSWAAYFINQVLSELNRAELPRWQRILPLAATVGLVLLFAFGAAQSPSGEGGAPKTIADLLLREVLYVYMWGLLLMPMRSYLALLRSETVFLAQTRIFLALVAVGAAASLAGVKAVSALIGFNSPSANIVFWFDTVGSLLKAMVVLAFGLEFLPGTYYRILLRPILRLNDLLVLRDLKVVERQVHRFCLPVVPESPSLWQMVRSPEYYLHRSLIHILDGYKNLNGYLAPSSDLPQAVPTTDSPLDKHPFDEVYAFYEQLSSVPADGPYEDLLQRYRELGRQLRKNGMGHAAIPG